MPKGGYKRRRSALVIMGRLIGLVKPLIPFMALAVAFGVIGYLCAIFLTIFAGYEIVSGLAGALPSDSIGGPAVLDGLLHGVHDACCAIASLFVPAQQLPDFARSRTAMVIALLLAMGVLRGVFHYIEQYCNHYIAFRLLAIVRHKVFARLRMLAPAKLEGRDKGDLVSLITSDIELLEVFYAHTISPIIIACVTCALMLAFIAAQSPVAALIALAGYTVVGIIIPCVIGYLGSQPGLEFRDGFGQLNAFVLDSLRGVDETMQYGGGARRASQMDARSRELGAKQEKLNRLEAHQRSASNAAILLFSLTVALVTLAQFQVGELAFAPALIATIAVMGSFGPVLALSSLSNNLSQTLACGDRVLDLLAEEPQVDEVVDGINIDFNGLSVRDVSFSYGGEPVLEDISLDIEAGEVVGVLGPSGCGKSTLLKLLMRFWDADKGRISFSGVDISKISTASLRDAEAYVTQESYLFHESIADNIALAKPGARRDEVVEAAKKASLHEFVMSLPDGYDTLVGELGSTLSGGERQRMGIARAFLHDAPLLLLDEPTSNLDSLNEGIILGSLADQAASRTVVMVSHRKSTLGMAERIIDMDTGRAS